MKQRVFVLDVDGTITDGKMYYSKEGKQYKAFGADDWCALKMLNKSIPIHFITGDRKGFSITQKRVEEECGYDLDLVSTQGINRWKHISNTFPDHYIIFMGDGIHDWYPLSKVDYSITTSEALEHTKKYAHYVTHRTGGNRAVAEACLHLSHKFHFPLWDIPEHGH